MPHQIRKKPGFATRSKRVEKSLARYGQHLLRRRGALAYLQTVCSDMVFIEWCRTLLWTHRFCIVYQQNSALQCKGKQEDPFSFTLRATRDPKIDIRLIEAETPAWLETKS
jgi:hypothetical protein